ncbi:MAG: hypothetical protein Ct9H300mP1_32330 [Planctomycetaceae bacterium]|nr:MAG: hypothetical protein Ct9H300mP1_32330 [Planctomycetaceae bacterium]
MKFLEPPFVDDDCRVVLIDPDAAVLEQFGTRLDAAGRLVAADLADSVPAIERLQQLSVEPRDDLVAWRDRVRQSVAYRPPEWERLEVDHDAPLHPVQVARAVTICWTRPTNRCSSPTEENSGSGRKRSSVRLVV